MLTLFSDLHLTDESTAENVPPQAFAILQDDIVSHAKDKADEIWVVMLGDIFDLVRTDYWLRQPERERPWFGNISTTTGMNDDAGVIEGHFKKILTSITETESGKALINMVNNLKGLTGKKVKVSYVIGNHDRAFNNFDSLKDIVKPQFNNVDEFEYCNYIQADEYGTLCRHGHEFDDNNHGLSIYKYFQRKSGKKLDYVNRFDEEVYKVMSIGEVITCELMSGIIYKVKNSGGSSTFVNLIKDLNNVRPMSDVFLWLYWYGSTLSNTDKDILLQSFKESIKTVISCPFGKEWDNTVTELWYFTGDITDRFEQLLNLIEDKNFDQIAKVVDIFKFFDNIFGGSKDDLVVGAKEEFKQNAYKDIQYILYGHTHEARQDYFYGEPSGKVKLYINTGTYLPYIQQSEGDNGFATAYQMTMAFIYKRTEDKDNGKDNGNPTLDIWNGIKRKVYNKEIQ